MEPGPPRANGTSTRVCGEDAGEAAPEGDGGLAAELDARLVRLHALLRHDWRELELSASAFAVLAQLRVAPRRVTELAATEQIAQPSMSALVNRLEERGLVNRTADARDARRVLVRLSAHGRRVLEERTRLRIAGLRARLEALSEADRAALAGAIPAMDALSACWCAGEPGG